tara:strand:+ start:1984 stop:3078 length:1095 start_codon:yes stop_codon:yes gene_type:complete
MLLISITLLYGVFAFFGVYLIRSDKSMPLFSPVSNGVSVIVALRNEEKNIDRLVEGLILQKYPQQLEFILIDDNSRDETLNLLTKWSLKDKRIKVLPNYGEGKKSSIATAVKFASNSIIVQTDADCQMNQYWVMSSVNKLLSTDSALVLGPVYPFKSKTILNRLIRLDWIAIQFMTVVTARLKNPAMANGANFTFFKKDYLEFYNSGFGAHFASGDDMFFMRFIQKKGKKISFNLDKKAIVKTEFPNSLKDLLQQRIRWATKSGKTTNELTYLFTLIVFLANFAWIITAFSINYHPKSLLIFSSCLAWKLITDFLICWNITRFYGDFKIVSVLPVMFFIYPIYLLSGLLLSFKKRYKWKGRRVS